MSREAEKPTLKYLFKNYRLYGVWPPETPSKLYPYSMIYRFGLGVYISAGIFLQLFKMITDPNYPLLVISDCMLNLVTDVNMMFSYIVSHIISKKTICLFAELLDYNQFGKPPNLVRCVEILEYGNKFVYFLVIFVVPILYLMFFLLTDQCKQINATYNITIMCGTPLQIYYYIYDVNNGFLFYLHLFLGAWAVYIICGGGLTFGLALLASAEVIITKIEHLSDMLTVSLNSDDNAVKRNRLRTCVSYHKYIMDLIDKVNDAFMILTTPVLIVYGVTIGVTVLSLLIGATFKNVTVNVIWIGFLFLVCNSCNRLIEKSISLADAMYDSEWYNCNGKIRKDVLFILRRCQKPLFLKTGLLGYMISLQTFTTIMKAAYTYGTMKTGFSSN